MGSSTLSSVMAIRVSPSFFHDILPPNWRAISAHTTTKTKSTYILSPEGKRFSTVEAVNNYLTDLIQEKEMKQMEISKKKKDDFISTAKEREKNVTRRRKLMSDRNPLKNILKKTLKKNHFSKKCYVKQQKKREARNKQ